VVTVHREAADSPAGNASIHLGSGSAKAEESQPFVGDEQAETSMRHQIKEIVRLACDDAHAVADCQLSAGL